MAATHTADTEHNILVTGANAGLGFAICHRLIDEFLSTRLQSHSLTLVITTRSKGKAHDAIDRLREQLRKYLAKVNRTQPGISKLLEPRIKFDYELLDLCSLKSVQRAASALRSRYSKFDAVICNAGMGGWDRMGWLKMTLEVFKHGYNAFVWTDYKISTQGRVTAPQLQSSTGEPVLGEVFTANVFGHYMLVHWLMPLLFHPLPPSNTHQTLEAPSSTSPSSGARIIWISTLEAYSHALTPSDLQCLLTTQAYEASKRLTDVLALTSRLPSTRPWTNDYFHPHLSSTTQTFAPQQTDAEAVRPKFFLTHPGVCATSIMPLSLILQYLMLLTFHLCRMLGSIWHTGPAYTGATSAVWLALASESTLGWMEGPRGNDGLGYSNQGGRKEKGKGGDGAGGGGGGKGYESGMAKWGSAVDVWGNERVERTEVEGWGVGGVPGDATTRMGEKGDVFRVKRKGRRPGAKDLTAEEREGFEELGRECWRGMEELRREWEGAVGGGNMRSGADLH